MYSCLQRSQNWSAKYWDLPAFSGIQVLRVKLSREVLLMDKSSWLITLLGSVAAVLQCRMG